MSALAALVAAALAAEAGPPGAEEGRPAPPGAVELSAERAEYDAAAGLYRLEGRVLLRGGESTVRAPVATYQPSEGLVESPEGALLLEPTRAVRAGWLRLRLGRGFEARGVEAWLKERRLDLSGVEGAAQARSAGRNRLTLSAERVTGEGEERLLAEGVRLTPCDCGEGAPSWEIRAARADVVPGERATLTWAVLWVTPRFLFIQKPVPVLPLPWVYLPLGERQTGLLLPEVSYAARTGWTVSEPLFLVLGRSLDATVTADYAFGSGAAREVRGPGTSLELRWAPDEGSKGELRAFYLRDLGRDRIDLGPGTAVSPEHGDRFALRLVHGQRFSERAALAVEANLVGDPEYVQDFVRDLLLGGAELSRSSAAASLVAGNVALSADLAYQEPLANLGQRAFPADPATGLPRVRYGLFGSDVPWLHRASASASLLPVPLAGPLRLSGTLQVARFAPVHGSTGDEGADGRGPGDRGWNPAGDPLSGAGLQPDPGEGDGQWQPGERLAATRGAAAAELRAPLGLGRALALEPWLRGSALGYDFAAGQPSRLAAWASGGLVASTRLRRAFGEGPDRLVHLVEPRVEWRAGTGLSGGPLPAYGYDELDAAPPAGGAPCTDGGVPGRACLPLRSLSAVPDGPWSQVRLALRTRLARGTATVLELDLGQDVDLRRGALSETFASGALSAGPVRLDLLARFLAFGARTPPGGWEARAPSWLDRFTELRVGASLADRRGDELHAGVLALGPGASGPLRAGAEPLFDPRPLPFEALAQANAGARARLLGGLDATYEALFNPRTVYTRRCDGQVGPVPPHLQQQTFGLAWDSPCRCFKMAVGLAFRDCEDKPQFFARFDLSQLAAGRFAP